MMWPSAMTRAVAVDCLSLSVVIAPPRKTVLPAAAAPVPAASSRSIPARAHLIRYASWGGLRLGLGFLPEGFHFLERRAGSGPALLLQRVLYPFEAVHNLGIGD